MAVTVEIMDKNGNTIYEEHDDGYWETNTYTPDGKLIQSACHYANGIVEVENYNADGRLHTPNY